MITPDQIKNLRQKTGIAVMECKTALEKTNGNEAKALKILEAQSQEKALQKAERETKQGIIEAYLHANSRLGVLLELNCETDFVAKNSNFKQLAHDIAMHIAAMEVNNIEELLSQPFIKDPHKTIGDLINEAIAKLGENIKIGQFAKLEV